MPEFVGLSQLIVKLSPVTSTTFGSGQPSLEGSLVHKALSGESDAGQTPAPSENVSTPLTLQAVQASWRQVERRQGLPDEPQNLGAV